MSEEIKEEISEEAKEENKEKDSEVSADKEGEEKEQELSEGNTAEEEKQAGEDEKEKPKMSTKQRLLRGFGELLLYVAIALICLFVIPRFVVQRTVVSGDSMENTLNSEDNILVEKVSYRMHEPKRFDVIVFYHYLDEETREESEDDTNIPSKKKKDYDLYVKRIIGLPGETVQIKGETIYIDGEPLEENYGKDPISNPGIAQDKIKLGEDEYFVLGDNREVSFDSRYEEVGPVKEDLIVGRAWIRIWPLKKIGKF